MAAISFDQGIESCGGGGDLPVVVGAANSCFQILNPSFDDDLKNQCTLDVVPILFEDASFPIQHNCSFHTSNGQDLYSISMLSEEDKTNPICTSQLAFLSFVELPVSPKKQMCLDPQLKCQNFIGLQMESPDAYSPCIVDIDIEMENCEKVKAVDETIGSTKTEGLLTGVLQRQASIKTRGRLMQLLTDHSSTLMNLISKQKSFNERVHDVPNNRWRKYKRAASFDSRKVVLFFSILSSLGTLILIYLTLRVRQTADGYVNI
ncbi:uncharacterized protein LOC126657659 [Mercurialis annua]|uniref:uncharacterized protein LOC126657659 n=1 Tax=Mercurialis annua TaxID=3986 RepID=UPI002160E60D|nr:uncharacterized protein LOC126657659 [Mercurialis annua]